MNSRDRILAALEGKDMDRIPLLEIGFWPETIERWRNEGFPESILPEDYFKLDKITFFSFDGSLQFQEEIIEEDEAITIYNNSNGVTYKVFKNRSVSSLFIESKIKSLKDWIKYKERLLGSIKRFEEFVKEPIWGKTLIKPQSLRYKESLRDDTFRVLVPTEPCWYYLRLLGEEEALVAIASEPDFAEQVISDYNAFNLTMIKALYEQGYRFDAVWVFSDLCYKNGMLFSPKFYNEKVELYHKEFFRVCKKMGMKVIYHCDGYLKEFLPLLIDSGIDCIQPMEVRAGNNVLDYIRLFDSRISFMGNINSDILATNNKEKIFGEISMKVKAKESGRYLFHSDHSIPPTISFKSYSYALDIARELGRY